MSSSTSRQPSTDSDFGARNTVPTDFARDTGKSPAAENAQAYELFDKSGNVEQDGRGGDTVKDI